ncbi:alpha/beta hydrolase [uncultured Tateyamaria sp.]|uniref:alpha/beta hydrolase n=1 Tax=uncultured Tateyamaria sp. TaxID=455651 RepID=UPI002617440C|nr:alpha/beta hydrolase [uncultured Tateyamaria sp.]
MSSFETQGPLRHRLASFLTLNRFVLQVAARHAVGRKMAADWDILTEVGIRFVRHQFTYAMTHNDLDTGRARWNSLLPKTPDIYDVTIRQAQDQPARWFIPASCDTDAVALYCHGGGYAFRGAITDRFAAMLAHHLRARVYMPLYRLTPEHPHPAQAEDALTAWHNLTRHTPPDQIVVMGDSAGGHMALMLLQSLKCWELDQPALCIGMCSWTDIGARGTSLTANDPTDLVQGWMALQFGRWLDPDGTFGRRALSPVDQGFSGLAPLYLQAGGREVLHDMIVAFAEAQAARGANVMLDVWPDMPHNFHAYDSTKASSRDALARLAQAFHTATQRPSTTPHPIVTPRDGVTRVARSSA